LREQQKASRARRPSSGWPKCWGCRSAELPSSPWLL
jgi:hypothetical protein